MNISSYILFTSPVFYFWFTFFSLPVTVKHQGATWSLSVVSLKSLQFCQILPSQNQTLHSLNSRQRAGTPGCTAKAAHRDVFKSFSFSRLSVGLISTNVTAILASFTVYQRWLKHLWTFKACKKTLLKALNYIVSHILTNCFWQITMGKSIAEIPSYSRKEGQEWFCFFNYLKMRKQGL